MSDEEERLRAGLQTIVDLWTCRSELFSSDEEYAANVAARALVYLEGFDARWSHQEAQAWREARSRNG